MELTTGKKYLWTCPDDTHEPHTVTFVETTVHYDSAEVRVETGPGGTYGIARVEDLKPHPDETYDGNSEVIHHANSGSYITQCGASVLGVQVTNVKRFVDCPTCVTVIKAAE